jgi:hypothetical protein
MALMDTGQLAGVLAQFPPRSSLSGTTMIGCAGFGILSKAFL